MKVKEIKKVALVILDGWGHRTQKEDNAIAESSKPTFDMLWKKYPHTLLDASGLSVGLPKGQMGNSEVGHTTIGAGKVVYTDLVRISDNAKKNGFLKNKSFIKLFGHVLRNKSTLHVVGLLSDGGIHSHEEHLFEFLRTAKKSLIKKIYIHVITDGRDTPPQSAEKYIKRLQKVINDLGVGKIVSICGRYYAMDRDNNWDRLEKFTSMIFDGKAEISQNDPAFVVKELYKEGKTDEMFLPVFFGGVESGEGMIGKNDGVFFFNFRTDRAKMISEVIMKTKKKLNLFFVTMTKYDDKIKSEVAFEPVKIETTLANEISKANFKQAHIAETEKFAHATYFLNGGRIKPHKGEKHILLDSRKDVKTHDLAPEMKAVEITDKAIEEINKDTDFIFINYANPDMIGHTANKKAIIKAIEVVDEQLGRLYDNANKKGYVLFITADHGNAEVNIDPKTKERHTAHTSNKVPLIVTEDKLRLLSGGISGLAPTILKMMSVKIPKSMDGDILTK
ncbi:MAG: 2,3-bisphosphoglycerate-independent phosphoglycerate mutase [Candidatus Paceibacterota bacterium]|jgi:2,3-bisphosphoglycerate-independent phosphoglycerate mutase